MEHAEKEKTIDRFLQTLESWKDSYRWMICKYIGIKTTKGIEVLCGRIFLTPLLPMDSKKINDRFESQRIVAESFVKEFSWEKLLELLETLQQGEGINDPTVVPFSFKDIKGVQFSPYSSMQGNLGRNFDLVLFGVGKTGQLNDWGIEGVSQRSELDWEVKSADLPYDNFTELVQAYELQDLMSEPSIRVSIIADSPCGILPASHIEEQKIRIQCWISDQLDPSLVKVGYKFFKKVPDPSPSRGSLPGTMFEWENSENSGIMVGQKTFNQDDTQIAQFFLSYKGINLHQWRVTDPIKHPNPRLAVHKALDQDREKLNKLLFESRANRSDSFEDGVVLLLHLLGFSVFPSGKKHLTQDGPDIIAFPPISQGNPLAVGVIQCTTGSLVNDKLAKLAQNVADIKIHLEESWFQNADILPLIITSQSKNHVETELAEAGKRKIAVLCREDLEYMLNLIELSANPDQLFNMAKQMIPSDASQMDSGNINPTLIGP